MTYNDDTYWSGGRRQVPWSPAPTKAIETAPDEGQSTLKRAHDWDVAERSRYKIVREKGEVDRDRDKTNDIRKFNGDVVAEYYDGVKIREHVFTCTETVVEPDPRDYQAYGDGMRPIMRLTAKFETKWCIDRRVTQVPRVIIDGRWTDPVSTYGHAPTTRVGDWGVYTEDYIDEYTRRQIEPLEEQYDC